MLILTHTDYYYNEFHRDGTQSATSSIRNAGRFFGRRQFSQINDLRLVQVKFEDRILAFQRFREVTRE